MPSERETVCRFRQPQADETQPPPDARIAAIAAEQHGVVTTAQLQAAGLTRDAIMVRARNGRLHPVHRGVYAVGHANLTRDGRFAAAVLAGGPGAVLSHVSAGALWGVVRWDGRRPEITVAGSARRSRAGLRIHRARFLGERDTQRRDAIAVTSAARTLLDLAGSELSYSAMRRAVRQAQALHHTNVRQIEEILNRANGRRGARRLAALIADGPAPTESGHEDVVLDLIVRAGIAHPDINVPLGVGRKTYRPDMRWPAQRLILEIDSGWHDGRLAQEDDAVRQAGLEAIGERVLRTTRDQAINDPRQLIQRLIAGGAPCTERR